MIKKENAHFSVELLLLRLCALVQCSQSFSEEVALADAIWQLMPILIGLATNSCTQKLAGKGSLVAVVVDATFHSNNFGGS